MPGRGNASTVGRQSVRALRWNEAARWRRGRDLGTLPFAPKGQVQTACRGGREAGVERLNKATTRRERLGDVNRALVGVHAVKGNGGRIHAVGEHVLSS